MSVEGLQQAGDGPRSAAGHDQPVRLDPRPDGRLFEQTADERWWVRSGDERRPWLPEEDPKVPLARQLPALRAAAEVRVLAYRPAKRLTLWITDDQGPRVLKGGRRSRLAAAEARHRWVAQALAGGPVGFPALLEVDEQRAAVAMEALDGRPFDLGGQVGPGCFPLGVALRRLQAARPGDDLARHDAAAELAVLDGLAGRVGSAGVTVPPAWAGLRRGLEDALSGVGGVLLPAHRDLHDGQVLLAERRLWLLDVDLLCLADPLLDAANLIAHVKLRELQGLAGADAHSVGRCGRELLDGLDRESEPDARRRLRFYQTTTFLRLALVYALRPPWRHLSRELLELARRCRREL